MDGWVVLVLPFGTGLIRQFGFKMNPIPAMNPSRQDYEVRIWYSPERGDECYVAQVLEMPGIMAHGDTRGEAAREIQAALAAALENYGKSNGQ